jgi:O-antigen/teichoic acid export membrane protein
MSHPLKKLMSQTAVYGLSSIVGRLLNYLLVPLYTHLFIPSEYGIVTNLYAYVGFLIVLLTYGMETAYFRFSQSEKDNHKVFSTAITPLFLTSGIFIAAMVLFSQNIASTLQYEKNPEYIIWFAIIIGFEAVTSIPFAKLRQENKPVKFAVYKFINIGLNIGFNLFFLLLLPYLSKNMNNQLIEYIYNPEIGIGYIFISNLLAIIITFALFIPDFFKTKIIFSSELLKKMLIYGSPLLIVGLAGMVNEVIDRILLKYLIVVPANCSDSENYILSQIGIYGANYKLSILMTLFVQAFRYAAEPFFFSHQKEQNAKQTYADVLKYFVIFGLLIFLGIMLYLDIVKYFINSRYHEGLQIVPILLLANLFLGIIYNLSLWYKLTDKTSFGALIAVGGAVVTIVLNIILIPKIGYLGSAWATFFCYFSMMVASYYFGQKYYFINYNLKKIFFYFFIAIGIYFINKYVIFSSTIVSYSFKTLLLLSFISIAFYKEDFISKLKNFRNK